MPAMIDRARGPDSAAPVFDRAHLLHYAMKDEALADEVLGLFLMQLPAMLAGLEAAESPRDWHFATHTLKGSAGSVGAWRLQKLAAELEAMAFPGDAPARLRGIEGAKAAAAEFRDAARETLS